MKDITIKLAVCKSLDISANTHKLESVPMDTLLWEYDITPDWCVALGRDKENRLAWINADQYQPINDKEPILMTGNIKLEDFDIISVDPKIEDEAAEYFGSMDKN